MTGCTANRLRACSRRQSSSPLSAARYPRATCKPPSRERIRLFLPLLAVTCCLTRRCTGRHVRCAPLPPVSLVVELNRFAWSESSGVGCVYGLTGRCVFVTGLQVVVVCQVMSNLQVVRACQVVSKVEPCRDLESRSPSLTLRVTKITEVVSDTFPGGRFSAPLSEDDSWLPAVASRD